LLPPMRKLLFRLVTLLHTLCPDASTLAHCDVASDRKVKNSKYGRMQNCN